MPGSWAPEPGDGKMPINYGSIVKKTDPGTDCLPFVSTWHQSPPSCLPDEPTKASFPLSVALPHGPWK